MIGETVEVYGLTEQETVYAWRARGFASESDLQAFLAKQTQYWEDRPRPLYEHVPPPRVVVRDEQGINPDEEPDCATCRAEARAARLLEALTTPPDKRTPYSAELARRVVEEIVAAAETARG
jgi:hypothetical protein